MDPVTTAFVALIAVVSGGIAYFADWLGRHLGKKRLRLAGLRPRHTAGVFVFSSGLLISLFTIGLVALLSSDVRQWIRDGRMAIRELNAAVAQRDAADAENKKILALNQTLAQDSRGRLAEINRAKATLITIREQTKRLQDQARQYQLAAQNLQRKFDSVQEKFLASTINLQSTERQRASAQHSLGEVQTQLASLSAHYHSLSVSYAELSRQNGEFEDYNKRLTDDNMRLTNANSQLEATGKDLARKNEEAAQSLVSLKEEIDRQTVELDRDNERIGEARQILARFNTIVQSSREQPLIYSAHQEIVRAYLPAHLTPEAANDAITSLLREARDNAEKRGAKSTAPDLPCADIYTHEDPKSHRAITPSEIIAGMVKQIAGRSSELVLVASSSLNAFEGEPVSIELKEYPNPLIYRRGQVIAESRSDRNENEDTIVMRIHALLQKVHDRAKKDNLIPSDDGGFGEVGEVQVVRITKAVASANRPVRLQAVVQEDTRAGDPLQIELRVR